jgi:hypothetical protein
MNTSINTLARLTTIYKMKKLKDRWGSIFFLKKA